MIHILLTWIFAFFTNIFIRIVYRTNRVSISGLDAATQYFDQGRTILAFWHSRLYFISYYYSIHIRQPQGCILISMSRDGDYGMALVKQFKQLAIRGSSSRGGQRAIRLLAEKLKQGHNIAITPDGPRGPAFQAQIGIIKLAQLTGAPIIPISYDVSRKKILQSWDRFILPKPFGRLHLAFGEALTVPRKTSLQDIEFYRQQLETTLCDLDKICTEQVSPTART